MSILHLALLALLPSISPQEEAEPEWLWATAEPGATEDCWFYREFEAREGVESALLWTSCDNELELVMNGVATAENDEWSRAVHRDITEYLRQGQENRIVAKGHNQSGPAGFWFELQITYDDGTQQRIVSNPDWSVTRQEPKGWRKEGFEVEGWDRPHSFGILGVAPWNAPTSFVDGKPPRALPAEEIILAEGFAADLVYTVPRKLQGSWVSIAPGPKGTLFTSDQYGGIYSVTPSAVGAGEQDTRVRRLPLDVGQAQGLLWAFGSLYFVGSTGDPVSGLYRAVDSDADGELDRVELLQELHGYGEHGPHAIRLSPDGQALYIIAGNHTQLPPVSSSRVPMIWGEDQLLPRSPDPRGHAVGVEAPGGWLCRVDPEGKNWELVSCGMRNAYDFALNNEGEMFTFDSDMEWDVGLSWYRPTRVLHLVSGSDFGWRHGSGKWPASYPDSWPAVVDIGLASPTGVEFAPASFPAPWNERLLIADWTHGTLHGVDIHPRGSSYSGEFEPLATGKPLQFTDLCAAEDGNVYFTTGGRRTQSALYRLRASGKTSPVGLQEASAPRMASERHRRQQLESLHLSFTPEEFEEVWIKQGQLEEVWSSLDDRDTFLRRAARVALEHQPVQLWQQRALQEDKPELRLPAMIALARCADEDLRQELLAGLLALPLEELDNRRLIDALRLHALIVIRQGPLQEAERDALRTRFEGLYPRGQFEVDSELCRALVELDSPAIIERSLALHDAAGSQEQKVHYLFTLKDLTSGWTAALRERYLEAFAEAIATFEGGASLQAYLDRARAVFLDRLDAVERERLAPLLEVAPEPTEAVAIPASFVRAWTLDEFARDLQQDWAARDRVRGKLLYERATCTTCHRFDGGGGNTGPDLTAAGSRFSPRDLLETIIDPNLEVSDQYQDIEIVTRDEELFIGRVELDKDGVVVLLTLPPLEERIEFDADEIVLRRPHALSRMPAGLLDSMKRDEVLDLVAYLITGTDGEL